MIYLILNVILIALITGFGAWLFSSVVFEILVGENYKQYSTYLPIFSVAASITAGAAVVQNVIFGYFTTKISSLIIFLTNLISIFIAFIFIYIFNFIGAAVGLVVMGLVPLIVYSLMICVNWMICSLM
jgi:O-antigen/teichoic acid export membrane protein